MKNTEQHSDPTRGKPRSSNIRALLLDHGPLASGDHGFNQNGINENDKRTGVTKFNPRPGGAGSRISGSGLTRSVYYIEGEHTAFEIVESWLETNEDKLTDTPDKALHWLISSYGPEYKKASREFHTDIANNEEGSAGTTTIEACPLCDEPLNNTPLASHLLECPEK